MSSKASEEMMGLLQELALLKQAEVADEGPTVHSIESRERQNRRREIADQIKALGEPAG
jgi:hypothetical protein